MTENNANPTKIPSLPEINGLFEEGTGKYLVEKALVAGEKEVKCKKNKE